MTARERTTEEKQDEASGLKAYIRDIERYNLLTKSEERELAERIEQGDSMAKERLVQSNLRLVVNIALKYTTTMLPLLDRIQAGNIGLLRAAEKYDWRVGAFSTYATWWIKQGITRAINEDKRVMHIPEHVHTSIRLMQKAIDSLRKETGREPTKQEIAVRAKMSMDKVSELLILDMAPASLDATLEDTNGLTLKDVLEVEARMEERSEQEALAMLVQSALDTLTEREQIVIKARFGIGAERGKTLLEVGAELGISRERVRQIEARVMREKLHQPMQRVMRQWNEVSA